MGLIDDVGPGPVGIDTAAFIYLIEEHAKYLPVVLPLFAAADRGALTLVTSSLTLLEVLTVPLRAGHHALAARYEEILTRTPGVELVDLDRRQLKTGALLRARTGMKTPDALQVAAALSRGCTALVTNDRRVAHLPELPVYQVADYA